MHEDNHLRITMDILLILALISHQSYLNVNVIPVIRELLLHNQEVVIPEFGSFLITQRPAQLNKVTRELSPPTTSIRFDKKLQSDDGKLTGALAQKLKLGNAAALKAIGIFIQESQTAIKEKGTVLLEGLGTLSLEKTGDIIFMAEEELLDRIKLFELPKLNIPGKAPEPPVQKKVVIPEQAVNITAPKKKKWWIPAAVLMVIIGLAAGIYFSGYYLKIKSALEAGISKTEVRDQNLTFGKRNEQESVPVKSDSLTEQISKELDERTAREKALSYQQPAQAVAEPHETPTVEANLVVSSADKVYHIIAGAFLIPNNADRQKAVLEQKGFSPVILPKNGDYYMVSLGSYGTSAEATKAMNEIKRTLDKEMWIMKR